MRPESADRLAAAYRGNVTWRNAYDIPHFAGMDFAYTELDAVFVWTHGGYQIARSHDDYPVFIQVHSRDVDGWVAFFNDFGVDATIGERPDADEVDSAVHYVLFPQADGIDREWVDGHPVIRLEDVVRQIKANRPAYEPALQIIAEEHDEVTCEVR